MTVKQRQHFCPHCDETFSLGRALQQHVNEDHPNGSGADHSVPREMRWMLGSAVEQ